MKKKKKVKISREGLMKRRLPYVGISFVMIMLALGINKFSDLNKIKESIRSMTGIKTSGLCESWLGFGSIAKPNQNSCPTTICI